MKPEKSFINKKSKGRAVRYTALLIIAVLLISVYSPVPAGAASLKEEVVYVRLANDGSVSKVYVVNRFQVGEENEIIDYGNYAYVKNLSDTSVIRLEDGKVILNPQQDEIYYEGFLADPELPWNISITYILDGRKIDPDDLPGKSGKMAIHIETGANPRGSRDFFEKYALQISLTLKNSLCKNILAEGATISAVGSDRQVNYVVLPGKAASLEIKADVEKFEMPAITIAGVRLNMDFDFDDYDMSELNELMDGIADLDDGVQELLDGIFDMRKGVSELHDGTAELRDGVGEFKDGIGELSEGTGELRDGVSELKDGTVEMADGASKLADGASDLVDGVRELDESVGKYADGVEQLYDGIGELLKGFGELYSGMDKITKGSEELKSGASDLAYGASSAAGGGAVLANGFSTYFDVIIGMVNAQLSGSGIPELTRHNYINVLESILYGDAISQARLAIEAEVVAFYRQQILNTILQSMYMDMDDYDDLPEDHPTRLYIDQAVESQLSAMQEQIDEQVESILASKMDDIRRSVEENPGAQQLIALLEMLGGYDQLLNGLNQYVSGVNSLSSGVRRFYTGVSDFNEGLEEYESGLSEFKTGLVKFYDESHELVDGINKLKEGTVELLDGVIELKDGIVEFKDGTIELRDGVIELFDGIVELHNGVVEMYDGAIELNDGVIELNDGTGKLRDGTNDLYDGVAELKDGTGELRSETATLDKDIIDAIREKIDEMLRWDVPVKSFVSGRNGEISSVQFVMQTEGISIPEETEEIKPEPKLTFWQRFIRLFGF
jgi:putative membrane protein